MKYLVLDGNSVLNRAFYGIRMLSNKKGQMTNGIYGFLSTLQKLIIEVEPSAVAVAFDLPAPNFRHKMYDKYKATRKKMPEELAGQLPVLKDLLSGMGYNLISCEGYEADDILGTFARYCENKNYECVLATGDKDSLQLISPKVTVRIAATKFGKAEPIFYDENKIREDYGVSPRALIDIKALQGDISDNIPGVKGIGEKTAKELIQKFGSIENIYKNIDELDIKQSIKNKLSAGETDAHLSYKLGEINCEVPIEICDEDYIPKKADSTKVKKILTELEFYSFINKMNLESSELQEEITAEILTADEFESFAEKARNKKHIFFSFECENSETQSFCTSFEDENKVYILSFDQAGFLDVLKYIMESEAVKKITYDIKKLKRMLEKLCINLNGAKFDIMLAAYLLNPSAKDYDIFRISDEYEVSLPNVKKPINESVGCGCGRSAEKVYLIKKLAAALENKLVQNSQLELLINTEQPLAEVLASMENVGFMIDKAGLEKYSAELAHQIHAVQNDIFALAGCEFNINSPKQLGEVLFQKLELPAGKKGKSGYSTGAAILEKLRGHHVIIDSILEYREFTKLKSTYCDGIIKLITPQGRVHSSFNQTETRTGRISSTEPNMQNIPVRTERGRELRKYFCAKEGCVLVDADYSQIELRVLAHVSGDGNMIDAFKNHKDIHSITASQILGIPLSMVTSQMRFRAKAVNFGILYGMGAFSLSQDLKISLHDAQNYINRYLAHYERIDEYMKAIIELAKKRGFAETIFNRRRYLPELSSPNFALRSFGERVARNMPIQGTAADIIKIAMINVYNSLKKRNLSAKLILQVHDELIIETPQNELEEVKALLKYEMENAAHLKVPLEVNTAAGKTWFDAKG